MSSTRLVRLITCAFWLLAVGAGTAVVMNHSITAGRVGTTPGLWPETHTPETATLLMFAHPRCPCTRASIGELNRLMARSKGKLSARVLFFQPRKFGTNWAQTDTWRSAAAIPGVRVETDLDGEQARQFGAETSGFVAVYTARGELIFKGGITSARGHAGDNAGADAIASFLTELRPGLEQTPVYGCGLLDLPTSKTNENPLCKKL